MVSAWPWRRPRVRERRGFCARSPIHLAGGHIFLDGAERGEVAADQWRRSVRYVAAEPAWWTDTPRPAFPSKSGGERAHRPFAARTGSRRCTARPADRPALDWRAAAPGAGSRAQRRAAGAAAGRARASLDPTSAAMVEELIKFQILSSRSVILVSHDRGQVERLSHARLQLAKPAAVASDLSARGAPA